MIKQILDLLSIDGFYVVSEEIEIAKGRYKIHTSLKGNIEQVKRQRKWRKRK